MISNSGLKIIYNKDQIKEYTIKEIITEKRNYELFYFNYFYLNFFFF